ncbi:MAG: hypothetical protein IKY91_06650 [Akkermansia sp.]|nr:hypothetical protein [Akkermansia sp.]
MKLSSEQTRLFWRTFKRACEVHRVPKAEEKTFRQGLIFDAIEQTSLTQVKPGRDFDAVMLALARLAGDMELVDHFSASAKRREAHLAEKYIREMLCLRRLPDRLPQGALPSRLHVRSYLASMLEQRCKVRFNAAREDWWEDVAVQDVTFLMRASAIALKREKGRSPAANR